MSETKGWLGWMTESGALRKNESPVLKGRGGAYTRPVYILPLDPDGPLPGNRMLEQGYGTVEVVQPRVFDWTEGVTMWTVVDVNTRQVRHVHPDGLSPIPSTRTVTVELTETEEEVVKRFGKGTSHPTDSTIRKLLAALEDS